jgi:hypothetical protein
VHHEKHCRDDVRTGAQQTGEVKGICLLCIGLEISGRIGIELVENERSAE